MQINKIKHISILVLFIVAICVYKEAYSSDVLDTIARGYRQASRKWLNTLFDQAKTLFTILATIEILLSVLMNSIFKSDFEEVIANFIKKMMGIMFFYAILQNFDSWIPSIIDSFVQAGSSASGLEKLTPSAVFDRGLDISTTLFESCAKSGLLDFNPGKFIVAAFAIIGISISFTIVSIQMLVTLIHSYICISAGVLFLGFAGSKFTRPFTEKYLSYCVATGIKLFFIYLVIGVGHKFTSHWASLLQGDIKAYDYIEILCSSIVYAAVCFQVPNFASSVFSGALHLGASEAIRHGGHVLGSSTSAASSAGRMGAATLGNAVGAVQSIQTVRAAAGETKTGVMKTVGAGIANTVSQGVAKMGRDSAIGRMGQRIATNSSDSSIEPPKTASRPNESKSASEGQLNTSSDNTRSRPINSSSGSEVAGSDKSSSQTEIPLPPEKQQKEVMPPASQPKLV